MQNLPPGPGHHWTRRRTVSNAAASNIIEAGLNPSLYTSLFELTPATVAGHEGSGNDSKPKPNRTAAG